MSSSRVWIDRASLAGAALVSLFGLAVLFGDVPTLSGNAPAESETQRLVAATGLGTPGGANEGERASPTTRADVGDDARPAQVRRPSSDSTADDEHDVPQTSPLRPLVTAPAADEPPAAVDVEPSRGLTERLLGLEPNPEQERRTRDDWERRTARLHDHLVVQAEEAGATPQRASAMRDALADYRSTRTRIVRERSSGEIGFPELATRARANKTDRDAALARILRPTELAALDRSEARFQVSLELGE